MRFKHIHEDAASYALGALDARESQDIEGHCKFCPPCEQLAQDAQQIAHRLGFLADPVAPPPGLKQRLMVRLSRDELEQQAAPAPVPFRRLRLVSAALAAMFVISMVYTLRMSSAHNAKSEQLEALRSEIQLEHEFLARQGTTMRPLSISPQSGAIASNPTGMMYMRPGEDSAMLVVDRLPQLPADQVYRGWFAAGDQIVPVASFSVDDGGHKMLMISTDLAAYTKFMITVEPATGGPGPGRAVLECEL